MRYAIRSVVMLVGIALAAALPLLGSPPASAAPISVPATVTASTWTVTPNVSASLDLDQRGVSCVTSTFCMAVGVANVSIESNSQPAAEMWNGSTWASVQVQQPANPGSQLQSVSCVSATWCVAVGQTDIQNDMSETLIEQWDGTQFSIVNVASPSTAAYFDGVSCLNTSFCVAAGASISAQALFAQWNGTTWTMTTLTPPAGQSVPNLTSVSCGTTTSCMAVGYVDASGGQIVLAYQWNGSSWSESSPIDQPAPIDDNIFSAVSCVGASFCAAGGEYYQNSGLSYVGASPLVEVWNGSSWSQATLPATPGVGVDLSGISCFSATSCTAVGYSYLNDNGDTYATLALTWDGQTWAVPTTPNSATSPSTSYFNGVDCLTNWACVGVGGAYNGSTYEALAASAPIARSGYRFVAQDGGVFNYGSAAPFLGSMGGTHLNAPIVGMAVMPGGDGYYLVASDGGVFNFGSAKFYGSTGGTRLNKPIVGMAVTADGAGYWLVASDGGIFAYGDAQFFGSTGSIPLNKPIVGVAATSNGLGYFLVASDGGIFAYGNAVFAGSMGGKPLNQPIVGMAVPVAGGYYLVASDGGIFTFPASGGPPFSGSTGSLKLNKPIVGMTTATGGYYLSGSDGGVFAFPAGGVPPFLGSTGSTKLNAPIVGIAT